MPSTDLTSCHCCGLIQRFRSISATEKLVCQRCKTPLDHHHPRQNQLTAALSMAALVFYFPAMSLPMLRLERLGQLNESSLIEGIGALFQSGHFIIALIILGFSVLLPPLKLFALTLLSLGVLITRHEHKAIVYRAVERLGRWGMLDVLLVAVLVAFVKLGGLIKIQPGHGLTAFTAMVILSLLASLFFSPTMMWDQEVAESD